MTPEQAEAWNNEMARLKRFNLYCMAWHAFQGAFVFMVSYLKQNLREYTLPAYTIFVNWDNDYPVQDLQLWRHFNFLRMCSFFAILSAAAHGFVLLNFDKYERDLRKSLNRFRWYEYALSSSLMIMLVMWLWGNLDVVQLSAIFVLNACMNLFGDLHELLNAGRDPKDLNWKPFIYGSVAGGLIWLLMFFEIGYYLTVFAGSSNNYIPSWFWIALFEYFTLFNAFPINMVLQYKQWGPFNNEKYPLLPNGGYLRGEGVYQWLSLIAKTILLWQVALAAWSPDDTYESMV